MNLNQIINKLESFKNDELNNEIEVVSINFNNKCIEVFWNYKGSHEIYCSLL